MSAPRLPWRRGYIVFVAIMCWVGPRATGLRAQSDLSPAVQAAACVRDTDTVFEELVLGLSPDLNLSGRELAAATTVAVRLASFVVAPLRLTIDKLRGPGDWTDATGTYHSDGLLSLAQLVLELDATGRTARRRLDPGTGSPEVDGAIFAAIATADSTAAFLLDSTFGPQGPRQLRLWLLTAVKPPSTWASPLFRVAGRVPAHASPIVVRASSMPSYPKAMRGPPTEGDVVLAFEVDEHGEVPESSLRVVRTDDSAFVAPALRSVRETRFEPATEGGCVVRARMQQWVHFKPPRP